MEEEKKLYPFRLIPIPDSFPWGDETHCLADLGYRDTQIQNGWLSCNTIGEVMDMYMDRIVGEKVFEYYGRQFPVGIKEIDALGRTPLIVHPCDETAAQRYDFLGKAKLWYVLETRPDATLYLGFKEDVDVEDFYKGCIEGGVEHMLNAVHPRKGDHFLIRPGTVHAAQGVKLLEIGEASPLDFCLTGWGQEVPEEAFDSELNVVEALDFIDYSPFKAIEAVAGKIAAEQEFTVTRLDLTDPLHILGGEGGSFAVYSCLDGEAEIQVREGDSPAVLPIRKGDTILVPAEVDDFFIIPRCRGTILLETMVERTAEEDAYIDPNAEPQLPDEGEEFTFNSVYGRFSKN